MATLASHHDHSDAPLRREWTPQRALKFAWMSYLTLGVIPLLFFLYVVWAFNNGGAEARDLGVANRWFIGTVAYMVLIVPATFFVRSRFFRGYWRGDCVAPGSYLKGMMVVWLALVVGGLLGLTGCLVSRAFAPCILPAIVGCMAFAAMWPNGRAMICMDRGASDDPEKYEEPR